MSLKGLFSKDKKTTSIASLLSFNGALDDVESIGYIDQFIKDRKRYKTHTDYFTASNFCAYGSLEEYYRSGVDRIINTYPYDGSLKEKLQWFNDSSGFDLHLFESEYPRTNGYIQLGSGNWGEVSSTSGSYGNPETKEYIFIKGGPNVGNVHATASHQTSNLEINGRTGNTVEFWLKKGSYETTKTAREVVFDNIASGSYESSTNAQYGRLTIELDNSDISKSPFRLTYRSGSDGFAQERVGATHLYASASDNSWHHYAFSFKNVDSKVRVNTFVDGVLNDSRLFGTAIGARNNTMVASIGALVAAYDKNAASSDAPGEGHGKLSGYLDEFRYWKKERTAKDVGRFWFTQVGAGSNTDVANSSLGFYYKFNEGETGKAKIDKRVLDYSGRISNGSWVGYPGSGGRYSNSAMVEASASLAEFKDPIVYLDHPAVSSFRQDALERGYAYDLENASNMYYSYPDWIVDEDGQGSEDLKKITQVVASYFDSLFLQIKDLGELRHVKYHDFDNKPYPFNNIKLESLGLITPELFMDASNLNILANRDEDQEFKQSVSDVKNFIYNNIYNNLESIFKSKGTTKSFRNLFRCFGVDNELIKINLYSTDSTYPIETSYEPSSVKTKYVNFADSVNKRASVFQSIDGLDGQYRIADARGFLKGTNGQFSDADAIEVGMTTEAQIFLPKLYSLNHPFHFPTEISSSVFGCHRVVDENDHENINWQSTTTDDHSFQVYVAKEKQGSRTGRFVLKTRSGHFPAMQSPVIVDLYNSNRWNVAVRLANSSKAPVSGSTYEMQFYGVNTVSDTVNDSFYVRESISEANAKNFMKHSKRFYVGAENENFTGDSHYNSDIKVSNFRVWMDTLSNDEIDAHAIDPKSYGLSSPSSLSHPLQSLGDSQTKRIDLLAINWDFNNLTGSNSNGEMWITDVSSGSLEDDQTFGSYAPITRRLHSAKGINFAPSTTSSVDVEYDQAARLQTFENVGATDMVKILSNDDITFTRDTQPTDYFFSFEKSMYAAITDEMLNFFGGISDFSNLIGAPVERYRPHYKAMSKLRQTFFSRVQNTPDIERYVEYYKWLDSSLSVMIDQLVPASVAASEDIRNVIESHVLERSKYFNKFPTMELKQSDPMGQIRGVNELLYDWQHGHAPIDKGPDVNCLWTKERAQRNTDLHVTSSGNVDAVNAVDKDRETIRRIAITSVSGSTYAVRRLSRPYRLSVEDQRHLKGGDNSFGNKKKRLFTGISTAHGKSHIAITGSQATSDACKDPIHPSRKKKIRATADVAFTGRDRDVNDIAPFTLYSSSLDPISGYQFELHDNFKKGVDVTNLHTDEYGDDREVTLQSPFTERWVGGNQHRHQDLSGSLLSYKHSDQNRLEAFKLLAQDQKLYVLPPNATGLTVGNVPIIDPSIQGAQMLREDLAKRPVNIRNIRTTTGSISLGNFNHPYDVVQYTSEDQRKDFLVDNDQPLAPVNSVTIPGVQESRKFERPARKHVFNARFSAPGGPETAGDSLGGQNLDRATNQYSVYNSLNYRNLATRGPLDQLSGIPQTASTDSNSLVTNHKVNANPRYRRRLAEDIDVSSGDVDVNRDNVFVRHPIPQNDYQYSWITASLVTGREPVAIAGHLHSFTQASVGDATGSLAYERTYEFLTASNREGTIPIDFAGLNTYIRDDIDVVTNTVTAAETYDLTGTIHHRQGPYGWPSWKQIRAGDSALGRYFKKNNLYSIPVLDRGDGNVQLQFPTLGNYSWPGNIQHQTSTVNRAVGNANYRFVDPPVSSNNKPIVLKGTTRRTVRFFRTSPVETGVPRIPRVSIPGPIVAFKKTYSFANNVSRFANDKLSKVLGIVPTQDEERRNLTTDELLSFDFTKPSAVAEYSTNIFPKEESTYLERSRNRSQYTANDFWRDERKDRTQTNAKNSQGFEVSKLSVWPMDGPENFDTVSIKRTIDDLGNDGSGELLANYSIFHNNTTEPVPSALFARPFPIQSTSSLPTQGNFKKFSLAWSQHRKASFTQDIKMVANQTLSNASSGNDRNGRGAVLRMRVVNSNNLFQDTGAGGGWMIDPATPVGGINRVPFGMVSAVGATAKTPSNTTTGPRIINGDINNNNTFDNSSLSLTNEAALAYPHAIGLVGTANTSEDTKGFVASADVPGLVPYFGTQTTHHRYIQTTGSVISVKNGAIVVFHARTGNHSSTTDDWGMLRLGRDLIVDYGVGTNSATWEKDVFRVGAEIDTWASNTPENVFRRYAFHIPPDNTAAFANGVDLRFRHGATNATVEYNEGWLIFAPTVYHSLETETGTNNQLLNDQYKFEGDFLGLAELKNPIRSFSSADVPGRTKKYYTAQSSDASLLSLGKLYEYGDEVQPRMFNSTMHFSASIISSDTYRTFDQIVRQDPKKQVVSYYQKDDKAPHHLHGSQFFRTPEHAARNPFNFGNYRDFKEQARLLAKDYAIVPEFRISEHMDYYINTIGGDDPFFSCNDTFLSITGSSEQFATDSSVDNFYEVYSHSDFLKHFNVVEENFREVKTAKPTKLKLECRAFKKFLPYKGLYPADRMTQLAAEFSSSYSQYVTGGHFRNALAPYYAPGIGFNTIKSGIAVDYPVVEPHEDRIYNQYGIMFQSASLAIDEDFDTVKTEGVHTNGTVTGKTPIISGDNAGSTRGQLSMNRIEIGQPSDWAKMITGSLAPGGEGRTGKALTVSLWMYFPKSFTIAGSGEEHAPSSIGMYRQKGNIISIGAGAGLNQIVNHDDDWKRGINFGYFIGVDSMGGQFDKTRFNNKLTPGSGLGKHNTGDISRGIGFVNDRNYTIGFTAFGGKDSEYFSLVRVSNEFRSSTGVSEPHRLKAIHPGWNHVLLSLEIDNIGLSFASTGPDTGGTITGFNAWVNGERYTAAGVMNCSSNYFDYTDGDGNVTNSSTADPVLDAKYSVSCRASIGCQPETVERWNKYIASGSTTGFTPSIGFKSISPLSRNYNNTALGFEDFVFDDGTIVGASDDSKLNTFTAGSHTVDSETITISENIMQDFLFSGENMMSEIVILNTPGTDQMAKTLSGYVDKTPDFRAMIPQPEFGEQEQSVLKLFSTIGDTLGPRNPYTCLPKSESNRIIGWYRPGGDSGYTNFVINRSHAFNHAQDLFSGKILNNTTGSAASFDEYNMPTKDNHLSGTFYGFTEWSGSLYSDLDFSSKKRQRWNGIVDISNPAQYTYKYVRGNRHTAGGVEDYRTWYGAIGSDFYYENNVNNSERLLHDNNEFLKTSYSSATGSVKIPSFIVGTKFNFTSDTSVPRIGSASFGTYHFTGSGQISDDIMGSHGWRTQEQKNTGIRKVTRVPFESIISPEIYTPEMKGDGKIPSALLYEVEPHPSASLLGAFTNYRRYAGQNDHGQQSFNWSSTDYQEKYKTDENFHFGIPMNSSSMLTEFDLKSARSNTDKSVYTLAANNFYAESINFFIANKKGVTIRSQDKPRFIPEVGKVYQMSVDLNSGFGASLNLNHPDNPMYNNPAAFGVPFDAGRFRKQHSDGIYFRRSADLVGYGFSPYLPPHYDGQARAVFTFTPQGGPAYSTIESILQDTEISYIRRVSATGSVGSRSTGLASNEDTTTNNVLPSYNRRYAMHLSSSFNGLSFQDTDLVQSYDTDGNVLEDRKSLVIQSKFECPTFDFRSVDANQPRTAETLQHLSKIKGIWHQTGSFKSLARPYIAVTSPRGVEGVDDLAGLLGLRIENSYNKVGEMPDQLKVFEGVVAVPFRTVNGVKSFYNLPPQEVYQAVRDLGYSDYKLQTEEDRRLFRDYANSFDNASSGRSGGRLPGRPRRRTQGEAPSTIDVRPPIMQMVNSMMRYNMPPQFNFLKYNDQNGKYIKPFAMYVFDFSVTLPREDIARIWQNVTPDFGLDDYGSRNGSRSVITSNIVEHDLFDIDDLLDPSAEVITEQIPGVTETTIGHRIEGWRGGLTKDTQWMVFKVKQKAQVDYFRKKELDRLPDGHPEKKLSVENDIFKYGFNWPYDYFSIVELVNLNASVSFASKSEIIDEETARILNSRRDNE